MDRCCPVSCVSSWCWSVLVRNESHWPSLFFPVCPAQSVSMLALTWFSLYAQQPCRRSKIGVGLLHYVRLRPARSLMAVLCPACGSSDALQKAFIAMAVQRSSDQQSRTSQTCTSVSCAMLITVLPASMLVRLCCRPWTTAR